MSFVCAKHLREGKDPLVRNAADQYVIEVAAKSNDGRDRAAQVSLHRLCKEHAVEFVDTLREGWNRNRITDPTGRSWVEGHAQAS